MTPQNGDSGVVLTTEDGKTWTSQFVQGGLNAVACNSAFVCEAAGTNGLILRTTDGSSWQPLTLSPAPTSDFTGISCPTHTSCFAVAPKGEILTINVSQ